MKNKIWATIEWVLIIVLLFSLIHQTETFWRGYHNVDLVMNVNNLVYQFNSVQSQFAFQNLTDTASDGENRPLMEYYRAGLNMMSESFILAILTTLALSFLLADKFFREQNAREF